MGTKTLQETGLLKVCNNNTSTKLAHSQSTTNSSRQKTNLLRSIKLCPSYHHIEYLSQYIEIGRRIYVYKTSRGYYLK